MSFFNSLKWFFVLLIYLSLSTSSEELIITKFIKDLCAVLKYPIPATPRQCSMLFGFIVLRYYPLRKSGDVKKEILGKRDNDDWAFIFRAIEVKFKKVEALLNATELQRIPTREDEGEWERVKRYMNKLVNIIFDSSLKEKLTSSLKENLTTTDDYIRAFKKMALIYDEIPSSKAIGYLKFHYENKKRFNLSDVDTMLDVLVDDMIAMEKICRHYACALKIQHFIGKIIFLYYAYEGGANLDIVGSMFEAFDAEESRKITKLEEFYQHLVKLAHEDITTDGSYIELKNQWNNVRIKTLKVKVKEGQTVTDLERAIFRILNAQNADAALEAWQNDRLIWQAQFGLISNEAREIITKLAKPLRETLRSVAMENVKSATINDIDFAITLHENKLKSSDEYKKCVWIMTYLKTRYIEGVKKRFQDRFPGKSDDISRNNLFCVKFVNLWTVTSFANVNSANVKKLPDHCEPNEEDFKHYMETLESFGKEVGIQGIKDFVEVMMDSDYKASVFF